MNIWAVRAAALVIGVCACGLTFYFWGVFGSALKIAMEVPVVAPHSAPHAIAHSGEVSVSIVSPATKTCAKGQPCP